MMEKIKRKTQSQLEALESFYSEDRYPSRTAMECHAAAFRLTYKQVRGWFVEKRRREKRENKTTEELGGRNGSGAGAPRVVKHCLSKAKAPSLSRYKQTKMNGNHIQELLTPDYILKKVFRKDGPPLGVEFDSLPSRALFHSTDPEDLHPPCKENQRETKRRKVTEHAVIGHQNCDKSAPVKKHGVGKGLMTVWRATNPDARDFPVDMGFANGEVTSVSLNPTSVSRKPVTRNRRLQQKKCVPKQGRVRNKVQEKRKHFVKRREVESNNENQTLPSKEKCELALEGAGSQEHSDKIAMLVEDEELELRQLQGRPNALGCSDHFTTNGDHACSLCKDFLAKFPPNSVKMKQPFCMQPWDSSPEIVKKLFKVFHFLCTYAVMVDISSFTIDEFAQAFQDKDSLLLGKIHVALLKLLLSNVEAELRCGSIPHLSKSCNFLAFIHSVENQESTLEFWKRSLNPLTWTEILRQVLVAAGFGSKQGAMRRDALSKEMSLMVKYGLRPGTLKGELFRVLLEQGIHGLKVSELAKSLQISELNLSSGIEELESLIGSTLSSDITLFEKISSSTYRVRINSSEKEVEESQSDTEDSGAVDDDLSDSGTCSSDDDSGCNSGNSQIKKLTYMNHGKSKDNMVTVYTEIDESHPGEVWLLGLMEGEYSDLSIEEKLSAIVALIDLLHAGSSFRMEDPINAIAECIPSSLHSGSGAKIKRLSTKQHRMPRPTWVHAGHTSGAKEDYTLKFHPIDSSGSISKFSDERFSTKEKNGKEREVRFDLHPMQSVFLGSDRRYNRYWLFLGPCNAYDPGHRRVYFESSEDGHWEVIDTEEALCALLSVLDDRGKREALLIESLEKRIAFLCQAMSSRMVNSDRIDNLAQSDQSELDSVREDTYSPVSDVDNNLSGIANDSLPSSGVVVLEVRKKGEQQKQKWSRIQAFDSWLWNSFYLDLNAVKHGKRSYFDTLTRCESCHDLYWRDEKHCRICHTTFELHFDLEERYAIHVATCKEKEASDTFPKHKVLSSQIQSLKAAMHAIESVMPEDALLGAWKKSAHKLWVKRLRRTSSLAELLQVLGDFVGAINEDRLYECNIVQGSCNFSEELIASFACMPQTTSAVALWLVRLDALIAPYLERAHSQKRLEISVRGKHAPKQ
ncbi:homeobox-DDT domain protein RLT3 isoform X1 [Prunus avium]|uniref:Homeobox-DDT domain protein RLT3 isoform X1 n=1 Tax=Prunus avium TaxID=42229 RepID=A0A6P5T134_PRUAV|nr:homeobox-DDT domain protein RLT3 isoform X1 [Prunus avium]